MSAGGASAAGCHAAPRPDSTDGPPAAGGPSPSRRVRRCCGELRHPNAVLAAALCAARSSRFRLRQPASASSSGRSGRSPAVAFAS